MTGILRRSRMALLTMGMVMMSAGVAMAGPPLLCHAFEIGTARSLPWDASPGWMGRASATDLKTLVADTEALLSPDTPIIVRMETMRRAAIYASRDERIAAQLLSRLRARADATATATSGQRDALAQFDAGYLIETYREIGRLAGYGMRGGDMHAREIGALVKDVDGYALVQQSLASRAGDPAIEFASALISASANRKADYLQHAQRAKTGATKDALLARNLDHIGT